MSLVLCLSLVFLAGCTQRIVDFTVISTKNVRVPSTEKGSRSVGEDCALMILGIPTGIPDMEEAIDRAIEYGGRDMDALIDGVVYATFWYAFVVAESCYKVEGTPINTQVAVSLNDGQRENLLLHSRLQGSSPSGS